MKGKLIIFWSIVFWALVLWVWAFGGPGFLFWGAMLVVIAMAFSRYRQTRRDAFVQMLALAAERQMPLAPLAAAFAKETHGWRFGVLAARLEVGEPLLRAFYQSGNRVSPSLAAAVIAGEKTGALGPALQDAVRARRSQISLWNVAGEQLLYVCMVVLFALSVLTFYTMKIMPQMVFIADDFGQELPALTQLLAQVTSWLGGTGAAALMALFLTVAILLLLGFYIGWIRFRLPLLGRLTDRLDSAGLLRALAMPASRGQSFEPVLITLSSQHPNRAVRGKLRRAMADIDAGREWVGALQARGVTRGAEAAVLRAAERVGNLPWALGEMADSIERRLAYRLRAISQVVFPLAVLALGFVVMMFVVGYFLPLVSLISNMSLLETPSAAFRMLQCTL
jgi:type II secretory pathway component PulF